MLTWMRKEREWTHDAMSGDFSTPADTLNAFYTVCLVGDDGRLVAGPLISMVADVWQKNGGGGRAEKRM